MSYLLPHLHSGWEVDQAIVTEEDRVVVIRFGRDADPTCMVQDEVLASIAEKVKQFAVIYVCDLDQVPDFNDMYELYDACSTMFFFRNKHIMVDMGTGDNNKINWALTGTSLAFTNLFAAASLSRTHYIHRQARAH
jgi:U5 snRNP protein, DIM1 family